MEKQAAQPEAKYEATLIKKDGNKVCSASGTLMEVASWADNVIRSHGDCCVDIKKISA